MVWLFCKDENDQVKRRDDYEVAGGRQDQCGSTLYVVELILDICM